MSKIQSIKRDFTLKYLPIFSIEEVYLVEKNKKEEITDNFGYVNNTINRIYFNDEYIDQDIEIKYIAGYKKIPKTITHGILMHVVLMYEHPGNETNLNSKILDLYLPHRIIKI